MSEIIPILLAIISAIFLGSQYVPQKKLGKININHYNLTMTLGILITSSILCVIFYFIEFPILYWIPCLIGFFSGIVWAFGNRLTLISINRIGLSRTIVLLNMVSIYSFIFGVIFFSEELNIYKIIGLTIIVFSAIIVATISNKDNNERQKFNILGILSVIVAAFIISIFNVLSLESMSSSLNNPTIPYYVSVFFLSVGAILGSLILNLKLKELKNWYNKEKKFHALGLIAGLIFSFGILMISYTLAEFGMTISIPVVQTFMIIVSTFWGIFIFKEFHDKRSFAQFIIGILVAILGIIFLGLG